MKLEVILQLKDDKYKPDAETRKWLKDCQKIINTKVDTKRLLRDIKFGIAIGSFTFDPERYIKS